MLFLFTYNNNRNKVIEQQSLNFGKNQPEQTTESQLTIYKDFLHSNRTILYSLLTVRSSPQLVSL